MTLNPFDAIEKLIIEHGSSVIQGKHIVFLKDELATLKDKFSVLAAEKEESDSKIKSFETVIDNLNKKVDSLKKKIGFYEQSNEKLSHNASFKVRWGCILFPGDKKLYCPSCFHTNNKKVETSRVDSHRRYCPVCKTKIPSG